MKVTLMIADFARAANGKLELMRGRGAPVPARKGTRLNETTIGVRVLRPRTFRAKRRAHPRAKAKLSLF